MNGVTPGNVTTLEANALIGDGLTDCAAAISAALATGKPIELQAGATYAYATSPNFAVPGAIIRGNGAIFKHTGTGNAFNMDYTGGGNGCQGINFSDFIVEGNINSDNGVFARGVCRSTFSNIKVRGVSAAGSAFRTEFCVANSWLSPKCTTNEDPAFPMPLNGFFLTWREVGGGQSTCQTIISPVFEGFNAGSGIVLDRAVFNVILGGTSEGNAKGIVTTEHSFENTVIGTDLEACATNDLELSGNRDMFVNVHCAETVLINSGATFNQFVGGDRMGAVIDNGTGTLWLDRPHAPFFSSWNVTDTPDLGLYLRADMQPTFDINNGVQQLDSQEGAGLAAVQATAANRPVLTQYQLNGRSVMVFDGNRCLPMSNGLDLARNIPGITVFVVFRMTNLSNVQAIFVIQDGNGGNRIALNANYAQAGSFDVAARRLDADTQQFLTGGTVDNSPTIAAARINWGAGEGYFYLNGVQVSANPSFLSTGYSDDTDSAEIVIGAQNAAMSYPLIGQVFGVVVVPRFLQPNEMSLIGSDLRNVTGIKGQ